MGVEPVDAARAEIAFGRDRVPDDLALCATAYALPPYRPRSSLAKATTRIVRAGCFGKSAMSFAAAMVMPMPAASSIAPVPGSHESRWPPISTISLGFLLPVISPMTLADVASPFQPQSSATRTRVGPSASRRASWSASGEDSAADGIGVRPSRTR
jgi:hypothetical protein